MEYPDTIELKEKQKIWDLYFNRMYNFDELIEYFRGKYTYSQLKSIVFSRYKDKNFN